MRDGDTVVQFVAPFGAPLEGTPPTVPGAPSGKIELACAHRPAADAFTLG